MVRVVVDVDEIRVVVEHRSPAGARRNVLDNAFRALSRLAGVRDGRFHDGQLGGVGFAAEFP